MSEYGQSQVDWLGSGANKENQPHKYQVLHILMLLQNI